MLLGLRQPDALGWALLGVKAARCQADAEPGFGIFESQGGLCLEEPHSSLCSSNVRREWAPEIELFKTARQPGDRCLYVSTV